MDWQILTWDRLADATAGGLIVLAVGSLAAQFCRQPVRRAWLVVLTLLGGVAVPCSAPCRSHPGGRPVPPQRRLLSGLALTMKHPRVQEDASTCPRRRGSRDAPELTERLGETPTGTAQPELALVPSGPVKPSPGLLWPVPSASTVLLGCYFAVAAGFAVCWLVGQVVLWQVSRAARPVQGSVRDVLLGLAGSDGERVVLLESDRIALPFTHTWDRPAILLPSTLSDDSEPGALRYVLAHEWSHVERRDAWVWNLACLTGIILFHQPLFWWLRRQLRLCQDYLADERAAAAGSAEDYATFLVRLARVHTFGSAIPALGIGDRRSNLSRRVMMLVQDHEPLERHCRAAWSLTAASAAAAVIVVASGLRLNAAAPPEAQAPAKEAKAVQDVAKTPGDPKPSGETLNYTGTVRDKDSGKPIVVSRVVVRRSVYKSEENRVLQETRHTTPAPTARTPSRSPGTGLRAPPLHRSWTWSTPTTPPGPGSDMP